MGINYPHYIASIIYSLEDSGRGTSLGYALFIQHVLNKAAIGVPGLPFIRLSTDQEFTQKTLTIMGYHWDASQQRYMYVIRSNNVSLQQEDVSEEE